MYHTEDIENAREDKLDEDGCKQPGYRLEKRRNGKHLEFNRKVPTCNK